MNYDQISVGQSATLSKKIDWTDISAFARLTGDYNPVHEGEDGIVHGMLVASYVSTLIGIKLPGYGSIWISSHISFVQPIYCGDTVTLVAKVIEKCIFNVIRLEVEIYNQIGELCLVVKARVKTPN